MKKRWMDNMERLRGLVDEAVDLSVFIKVEGRCYYYFSVYNVVYNIYFYFVFIKVQDGWVKLDIKCLL